MRSTLYPRPWLKQLWSLITLNFRIQAPCDKPSEKFAAQPQRFQTASPKISRVQRGGINTKRVKRPLLDPLCCRDTVSLPPLPHFPCAAPRANIINIFVRRPAANPPHPFRETLGCAWLGVLEKEKEKKEKKRKGKRNLEFSRKGWNNLESIKKGGRARLNIWCPGSDLWSINRSDRAQRSRTCKNPSRKVYRLQAFHFSALLIRVSRELSRVFTRPVHNLCTSFGRGLVRNIRGQSYLFRFLPLRFSWFSFVCEDQFKLRKYFLEKEFFKYMMNIGSKM